MVSYFLLVGKNKELENRCWRRRAWDIAALMHCWQERKREPHRDQLGREEIANSLPSSKKWQLCGMMEASASHGGDGLAIYACIESIGCTP